MTKRPIAPVVEKGKPVSKDRRGLWDRLNANGDFGSAVLQIVMFPVAFSVVRIASLLKKTNI